MGSTNDWKSRLHSHNTSKRNTYTSKHRPWTIAAVFKAGDTRSKAEQIEKFIKKQKSRKLIERLIDVEFCPTGYLSELVRVSYLRD